MKLLAFTVYDEKAEVYATPFFTPAIGQASRMFADLANNKETAIGKHPEDYTLYHIGYYLDTHAKFDNNEQPVLIGRALDYIEREPNARFKEIQNAN